MSVKKVWSFRLDAGTDPRTGKRKQIYRSGFSSKNGTYLEPKNLLRKYKLLIKKANMPYIPFHNLRHTHATLLMRMGENPKVVSERLGHARVGITLDIYSHTNEEMQKKTAERFDDNFWT